MKKSLYFYLLLVSFIVVSFEVKSSKIKDIDGNEYHTVTIGEQTWLVENLKTTKYRNGDAITNVTDSVEWRTLTTGAQCSYNNDEMNVKKYGRLYNWHAVNDVRNIAPEGYHVASFGDWKILEDYLIANGYNYDGKNVGRNYAQSLAASTDWNTSKRLGSIGNNLSKNNTTGLTVLPGGMRTIKGQFKHLNNCGCWWSSEMYLTKEPNKISNAPLILMFNESTSNGYSNFTKPVGCSVRCVKDSKPTLTTSSVVISTNSTATSGGKIYADGGCKIISRGVCWSTSSKPTVKLDTKTIEANKLDSSERFTSSITGLTNNKTYHVRAYATYSYGAITDVVYGNEQRFTFNSETISVTDIDGNVYHTVKIGKQIWMVENLKTTRYQDGSFITNVPDNAIWSKLTEGARYVHNYLSEYAYKYVWFYNWFAVNDPRKLAPKGWHVATDEEWTTLIEFLGGKDDAGGKMKQANTVDGWERPNTNATNESGFNALPEGCRTNDGRVVACGEYGMWWSATQYSVLPFAWSRFIATNHSGIGRESKQLTLGCSVRCVKD